MNDLKQRATKILRDNILPFWMDKMADREHGGYYGQMTGRDELVRDADKGCILNARLLWSFAAAYRVLGDRDYLKAATRSLNYIIEHFYDHVYGGLYWSLDCHGMPRDTKKQFYAIGFGIYGLSEYARATGDQRVLQYAQDLYRCIEEHSFDSCNNGYIEACTREWGHIADMRLSDKDENQSKTMNSHLHILEPYTNLYRVWRNEELAARLRNLILLFLDKFMNKKTHHLDLFFDDEWHGRRNLESFGHDIEASWLLTEAADVLADDEISARVEVAMRQIADAADEGLRPDGAMVYERFKDTGEINEEKHWWVQCENVIGHVNLYQHSHDPRDLEKAACCLDFIEKYLIDRENGEWHWCLMPDGTVNTIDDKAGFWKCPYHNSRMCLELIERDF